jgi:hypothetical protein
MWEPGPAAVVAAACCSSRCAAAAIAASCAASSFLMRSTHALLHDVLNMSYIVRYKFD